MRNGATGNGGPPPGFATSAPVSSNDAGRSEHGGGGGGWCGGGSLALSRGVALTSDTVLGEPAQPGEEWRPAKDHHKVYTTSDAYAALSAASNISACQTPMQQLCRRMLFFMHRGDTVVDLSCGYNEWLPTLAEECKVNRMDSVTFKAFASEPPPSVAGQQFWLFEDWTAITPQRLGVHGDRLVMGLCPPWGPQGTTAAEFMRHLAEFNPRVIALVCPDSLELPPGYVLVDQREELFVSPARLPRRVAGKADRIYKFYLLQRRDTGRLANCLDYRGAPETYWDPDPCGLGFLHKKPETAQRGESDPARVPTPATAG